MVAGEVRLARKIPEIGKNEARRWARIAANTDKYCGKVLFLTEHCQYLCGRLQAPALSGKALPMKLFLYLNQLFHSKIFLIIYYMVNWPKIKTQSNHKIVCFNFSFQIFFLLIDFLSIILIDLIVLSQFLIIIFLYIHDVQIQAII